MVLDVNGYFAPPATGGLSLYTVTPCRVLDTRNGGRGLQRNAGRASAWQQLRTTGDRSGLCFERDCCAPRRSGLSDAVARWRSTTFGLNSERHDGAITSNMAIVPTTNGTIDAFSTDLTQLILDLSGYFAP